MQPANVKKCKTCSQLVVALSQRQIVILQCVADGRTSKEIAAELTISAETLKHEFTKIFEFLGAHDRPHAIAIACRANLI